MVLVLRVSLAQADPHAMIVPCRRRMGNSLARSVLDQIVGKDDRERSQEQGKNPHTVTFGKRVKGGHSRAKSLSAKKRRDIAKQAAKARWS